MGNYRAAVIRGGQWDTTQAAPRTVRTLLDLGYSVTVLCWDMSGESPARESRGDFEIIRYRRRVGKAGVKYFSLWLLWWLWLMRKFIVGRYDLVHVMNLDAMIPAVMSRIVCKHKIVYDIRDAWGLCLTGQMFPIPQIFCMLDRFFTPFADGLLLSQGDVRFCAHFFGRRACQRVPVIQVLNVPQHDMGQNSRIPDATPLTINYSGRISALRAAYVLADGIKGRKDVRMHVYGKLNDPDVRKRLESMDNVEFEGPVEYDKAVDYMDRADLISLLYDPALKVVFISSANKMFEAMMLAKPYICTEGSYPADVAERFKLGWALPYGDISELRSLLDRLVKNPKLLVAAGQNGRAAYEKHFRWEQQRAKLIALYKYLDGNGDVRPRKHLGWYRFIDASSDDIKNKDYMKI